jgi:hypothetical protein
MFNANINENSSSAEFLKVVGLTKASLKFQDFKLDGTKMFMVTLPRCSISVRATNRSRDGSGTPEQRRSRDFGSARSEEYSVQPGSCPK